MLKIYRKVISLAVRERRKIRLGKIYRRFREFTMISASTYVDNLILAERVSKLSGCVVECGVWRGGMIAGMAALLGQNRRYFLFDSFEGLPPAKVIDGEAALSWQNAKHLPGYYDNCTAPEDFAARAMTMAGASSFQLIKGWFNETIPSFNPLEPIAILRLDGDWYDSTMVSLQSLFELVAPGGLIVLDDYHTWDGCSRALHDFLSRKSAVERIQSFNNICFLERKGAIQTAKV